MPYIHGSGDNGLAVVCDSRGENDKDNDTVLAHWAPGVTAIGKREWNRTMRIALRDHGTQPLNIAQVREMAPEVWSAIRAAGITTVVILQAPATGGQKTVNGAWHLISGRLGSPYKWAGTCWLEDGVYKCPILHPRNYEAAYAWLITRWFRQALQVAQGRVRPMPWENFEFENRSLVPYLNEHHDAPVAVDIETNMGGTIITAIGLAGSYGGISYPWDGFHVAGTGAWEPGLDEYSRGATARRWVLDVLKDPKIPKILHNGAFDVYQLARRGIVVGGFEWDTLLMHRTVYPQYRHGLQQAAATEFCVEPWKTQWKPPKVAKGVEDKWLSDPAGMHAYNAKDAAVTWQLWKHLMWKTGF